MARQAIGFIKKYKQYLVLQKEQVRTETSDLCMLNQQEQYIVTVQEASSRRILVERWLFKVYYHITKISQGRFT